MSEARKTSEKTPTVGPGINQGGKAPATPSRRSSKFVPSASAQDRAAALAARRGRRAQWALLQLRQDFLDGALMRAVLAAARVRIASDLEPATAARLSLLLRRAGYTQALVHAAVGCTLQRFLELNTTAAGGALPLWAAVALVLEALGVLPRGARGAERAGDGHQGLRNG